MPELPEVQTIIDDLKYAGLIGREIQRVHVNWSKTIATDLSTFCKVLPHKTIEGLDRRGKFLVFHLSGSYKLLIHLRMTGRLLFVPHQTPSSPYIRLSLELDQGEELRFHDTRKFGRWYLVHQLEEVLHKLGPEPLDPSFTFEYFFYCLQQSKRALKPLLLDQTFIAGLGNIYVDEALWEAQLHPLQPANSLTRQEGEALYRAIQYVLKRGIDSQGTTLGKGRTNYYRLSGQQGSHQTLLQVFRQTDKPCHRCGHLIQRLKVAQRSTHICPYCQSLHSTERIRGPL